VIWGDHLHANEQPGRVSCQTCAALPAVEVFGADGQSHGVFCLRCGRRKLHVVQHLEDLFAGRRAR
jgi:Zn finger protein HypA/HybF involved in hydrogenase expression